MCVSVCGCVLVYVGQPRVCLFEGGCVCRWVSCVCVLFECQCVCRWVSPVCVCVCVCVSWGAVYVCVFEC